MNGSADLTVYDDAGGVVFQDSYNSYKDAIRDADNFLDVTGYTAQVEDDEGEVWVNDNDGKGWKFPSY